MLFFALAITFFIALRVTFSATFAVAMFMAPVDVDLAYAPARD
jgi:hypothetical protein